MAIRSKHMPQIFFRKITKRGFFLLRAGLGVDYFEFDISLPSFRIAIVHKGIDYRIPNGYWSYAGIGVGRTFNEVMPGMAITWKNWRYLKDIEFSTGVEEFHAA